MRACRQSAQHGARFCFVQSLISRLRRRLPHRGSLKGSRTLLMRDSPRLHFSVTAAFRKFLLTCSCACATMRVPSIDKGRYAFRRQKVGAGHRHRPWWAVGTPSSSSSPTPIFPHRKVLRSFSGAEMCRTRLTKQAGISPPMRKTKAGAVSAPKNRICSCQSRVYTAFPQNRKRRNPA